MRDKKIKGITLISLVITIIVLLILARSNNNNTDRGQWANRKSRRGKIQNRTISSGRRIRIIFNRKNCK